MWQSVYTLLFTCFSFWYFFSFVVLPGLGNRSLAFCANHSFLWAKERNSDWSQSAHVCSLRRAILSERVKSERAKEGMSERAHSQPWVILICFSLCVFLHSCTFSICTIFVGFHVTYADAYSTICCGICTTVYPCTVSNYIWIQSFFICLLVNTILVCHIFLSIHSFLNQWIKTKYLKHLI